jgi:hypothetical protein
MSYRSVSHVAKNAPASLLRRILSSAEPDLSFDLELTPSNKGPFLGSPNRLLGERFHAAIAAGAHNSHWESVSPEFLPYSRVLRDWLTDEGVESVLSEWQFRRPGRLRGVCDLLVKGGPNARGVVELKLTDSLNGLEARTHHLKNQAQVGMYGLLAAGRFHDYQNFWGALAYICPSAEIIRVYQWTSMDAACRAAKQILRVA